FLDVAFYSSHLRACTRASSLSFSHAHPPPDLHSFPTRRSSDLLAPAAVAESSHRQTHDSVPSKEVATLAALALGPAELIKESPLDRKSTRLNSSHQIISYAVFCLKKKKTNTTTP